MTEIVHPLASAGWDEAVLRLPGALLFHRTPWLRLLHAAYGHEPVGVVEGPAAAPAAVLPLLDVRSWLTGARGVSLPFTDTCPPLVPDTATFHRLLATAREVGRHRGWSALEFRGGSEHFAPIPGHQPSTSFVTHTLDLGRLAATPSLLEATWDPAHRRALRKAERSGLTVEHSATPETVDAFYGLLCLTRRRHGVPPQSRRFFRLLQEHVLGPGHGRVFLARHSGQPVAGAVFLHSGPVIHFKYGASDESFQEHRPNNLVLADAIRHYAAEGRRHLDFGRTSLCNEGLRRFKLGWGATETPLDYTRLDLRADTFVRSPDRATGLHTRLFRLLPPGLGRLTGTLLYPHLA